MDSHIPRREWAERSGAYSPEYYAHLGPNETSEAVRSALRRRLETDATVLELGCSSGRHLAHLADHGFTDLHGVEINDEAFDVMEQTFPDLYDEGTFYRDAIEAVVEGFATDEFDAVFSVETLQHLHPESAWAFDELVRITDDVLITVENEGGSGTEEVRSGTRESKSETEEDGSGTEEDGSERDENVNVVDDELPLYYRDWGDIFAARDMVQVDTEEGRRDTRRVFRTPDHAQND